MKNKSLDDFAINFYWDKVCPYADAVYRTISFLLLGDEKAKMLCLEIFADLQTICKKLRSEEDIAFLHIKSQIATAIWLHVKTWEDQKQRSSFFAKYANLTLLERACLAFREIFVIKTENLSEILHLSLVKMDEVTAFARKKIVEPSLTQALTPEESYLFAYIDRYNGLQLGESEIGKFEQLLSQNDYKLLFAQYETQLGVLQLALQNLNLDEKTLTAIREGITNHKDKEVRENTQISKIDQNLQIQAVLRVAAYVLAIFLICFAAFYFLNPNKKPKLDILKTLNYETIAFERDGEHKRLTLQSSDTKEIRSLFSINIGTEFLWRIPDFKEAPIGAAIIDYDFVKILAVQYLDATKNKSFYYYQIPANLEDLESTKNSQKDKYQTYASSDLNFIAWQQSEGSLALIASTLSTKQLIEIANSSQVH